MQKLKEVVSRGAAFIAAVALLTGVSTSALPNLARLVSADALNPLTERTLLLSSSAPGYINVDGSGNSTYAPPNSGPNGMKTGETFSFKVSTDSTASGAAAVKAFTFQFCTTAAGLCTSPGDDVPTGTPAVRTDDSSHADLNAHYPSPQEVQCTDPLGGTNDYTDIASSSTGIVNPDDSQGNFVVLVGGTCSDGWTMNDTTANTSLVTNLEDGSNPTGKNNYITLTNTTGITPTTGEQVKVIFYGTNNNYITNPGSGAFFVKINDYDSTSVQNFRDNYPNNDGGANDLPQNVIDGGVTVANVMNNSIQIHTKVLETLDFSVGTHDPITDATSVTPCMAIDDGTAGNSGGVLNLGNASAEDSLSTQTSYDTYSYWRLSSNSSNGATVYYSGNTLANTEGDHIGQIYDTNSSDGASPGDNSAEFSLIGSEQFGLGLDVNFKTGIDSQGDNGYTDNYDNTQSLNGSGGPAAISGVGTAFSSQVASSNPTNDYFNSWHLPQLFPLVPAGTTTQNGGLDSNSTLSYGLANGSIQTATDAAAENSGAGVPRARFAFSSTANTIPVPIASESNKVVNCSTGLMRYVGNIAATTPAGIYTTAINYLAAPEY